VLEGEHRRVALCNVDTIGFDAPEVDELRDAVAAATGAGREGVLLNWNHTHRAPTPTASFLARTGLLAIERDERVDTYWSLLRDRVVEAAATAASRLESAAVAWVVGEVDVSVNDRRERGPDGSIVHGWRTDGMLDRQVVSLQARRPDESVIATLVGFGCHTVSVGMDFPGYSADFPGALRARVRAWTGGECLYFQGAAGNVLPRVSFVEDESERGADRRAARGGGAALARGQVCVAEAASATERRLAHPDDPVPL
jgi:hypothetical protein